MNKTHPSFETERLLIKPTAEEDASFIFELLNSSKWLKNIGDKNLKSIEDAAAFIKKLIIPQFETLGFATYTVIRKEDNVKVGTCGLYNRDGVDGIDIGFALLPEYEKKGYAFESTNRLKEAAISYFKITEIYGVTSKNNIESQNLLKKIGLKFKNNIVLPKDPEELLLFKGSFDKK